MQVKIQGTAKELKPLRGTPLGSPLYTGLKINGAWYNLEGDHRNLYNKSVDLVFTDGSNIVKLAQPEPRVPVQSPPNLPPPSTDGHVVGHTPHWPDRESVTEAYVFYASEISKYLQDPLAIARGANCLIMLESQGEIKPVHRENKP